MEHEFKTLADYQKEAHKTCQDNCWNSEYLELNLIAEVGELAGKLSHNIKDDGEISDGFRDLVLKECGDVCWQLVELAAFRKDPIIENVTKGIVKYNIRYSIRELSSSVSMYINVGRITSLYESFVYIARISEIFGSSLQEVLNMNIKKLASRKERGVIQGNGDFR